MEYFDENNPKRCGQCDVCRERNKLELSSYEFDLILNSIKPRLKEQELSFKELLENCKYQEDKLLKVISWLTENEKIILSENNKYKWKD